jgi:hypothetical protein
MTNPPTSQPFEDNAIDFAELFARLRRGLPLTVGLGLLGLAFAGAIYVAAGLFLNVATTTRVVFSFPGFEKGEYPDKSKFSPDDLRSPEIISEALKRKGLDTTEAAQSKVRAALSIEAIIPDSVVKERDKQRATGQTPRVYIADEYTLTLSLPRNFPLSASQRESLLNEIVGIYQEKFTRTYVSLPLGIGKAFDILEDADYSDYELVMKRESENLSYFLNHMSTLSRSFRSPLTNYTFGDLFKQSQNFTEIRLNELLGLIRQSGLSKDRNLALVKMDYYIKTLSDEGRRAIEEEKVVQDLLNQARQREQNYALGVKSQAGQQRPDSLVVDQGLVDSLLVNDAYNFLVRKALEASLHTRRIQSEVSVMQERRDRMDEFIKSDPSAKTNDLENFKKSVANVRSSYENLINLIRLTYEDWNEQQYSDAIRISMQARTGSFYRSLAMAGITGLGLGTAAGLGLSLLGISFGGRKA